MAKSGDVSDGHTGRLLASSGWRIGVKGVGEHLIIPRPVSYTLKHTVM
jgi:hypothetical protein